VMVPRMSAPETEAVSVMRPATIELKILLDICLYKAIGLKMDLGDKVFPLNPTRDLHIPLTLQFVRFTERTSSVD
jgi:hypothetical protein